MADVLIWFPWWLSRSKPCGIFDSRGSRGLICALAFVVWSVRFVHGRIVALFLCLSYRWDGVVVDWQVIPSILLRIQLSFNSLKNFLLSRFILLPLYGLQDWGQSCILIIWTCIWRAHISCCLLSLYHLFHIHQHIRALQTESIL